MITVRLFNGEEIKGVRITPIFKDCFGSQRGLAPALRVWWGEDLSQSQVVYVSNIMEIVS